VGTNEFVENDETRPDILKVSEAVSKEQISRLTKFKAHRDAKLVSKQLELITHCAKSENNLMPVILKAVQSGCTVGEVSGALRQVFGQYKEKITI
jgi:methylmalonyl-CoA mutase N-terminal domain/subunit